jgi:hypothetical protein
MKTGKIVAVFAVSLGLAACPAGGDRTTDTAVMTDTARPGATATQPAPQMDGMERVDMRPVAGSNVSGEASITGDAQNTQIMVQLTGGQPGDKQGHIHQGRCDNIGPVAFPLESVNVQAGGTGSSTSTVNAPMTAVMDGNHLIAYHEAGGNPGAPVVCGDIPRHGGGGGIGL